MKVLLVEDQEESASYLIKGLTSEGFTVDWEKDGEKALWRARFTDYDLLLCDLHLPQKNGMEILKKLREIKNNVPFIMLTVDNELETRLASFRLGADDYLVKPFPISELLARVRAVLRRGSKIETEIISLSGFTLNHSSFRVFKNKKEIKLRRKEYDLLYCFMHNPNRVLSRSLLLEKIWDMNADPFTNTVDVHVKNLRKKIGDAKGALIRTVYGRGYEFICDKINVC